jgi:hypothetical protein
MHARNIKPRRFREAADMGHFPWAIISISSIDIIISF